MKLEGLLVDLVPYGKAFQANDHAWWNNEAVFWGSMGDRALVTRAEVEREHREWAESDKPETGMALGVQTKDGKPIGFFGINYLSYTHRAANLGAVISEPEYWGGGYGTDALLLLINYTFDWLDMRRIWLDTMALNVRVLRQMEKVGFRREAVARRQTLADGQWVDGVVFGLLREEWPGRDVMIERLGLRVR